jgi:hypothetical protein
MTFGFKIAVVVSSVFVVGGLVLVMNLAVEPEARLSDPLLASERVREGDSLWAVGEFGAAAEAYRQAISLDSASVDARLGYARALSAMGRPAASASLFDEVVAAGLEEERVALFDLRWRLHDLESATEVGRGLDETTVLSLRAELLLASSMVGENVWAGGRSDTSVSLPFIVPGEPVVSARLGGGGAVPIRLTLSPGGHLSLSRPWVVRAPVILVGELDDTSLAVVPAVVDTMEIGPLTYTVVPALVTDEVDRRSVGTMSVFDFTGFVPVVDFASGEIVLETRETEPDRSFESHPMWFPDGRPHVRASLADCDPRWFEIDINAPVSSLTPEYAVECGLAEDSSFTDVSFRVGRLILSAHVPSLDVDGPSWFGGVLGRDALADCAIRIDVARGLLGLRRG